MNGNQGLTFMNPYIRLTVTFQTAHLILFYQPNYCTRREDGSKQANQPLGGDYQRETNAYLTIHSSSHYIHACSYIPGPFLALRFQHFFPSLSCLLLAFYVNAWYVAEA